MSSDPEDEDWEPDVVEVPITDAIDLHTFRPRDVTSVVDSYLATAQSKGFREVRLIHGKGKGVQRAQIRQLLERHPAVEDFEDAPPMRGGWGATIVTLKGSGGASGS